MTVRLQSAVAALGFALLPSLAEAGTLTVLHAFTGGADGATPWAYNQISTAGTVFGVTQSGGAACNVGGVPYLVGCGTIYKIDSTGAFTTILSFTGDTGGEKPFAFELVGSRIFGITMAGGANGNGTLYSVQTNGSDFKVLRNFSATESGTAFPALDGAGNIYYNDVDPTTQTASVLKLTHTHAGYAAKDYTASTIYSFPAGVATARRIIVGTNGKLYMVAWSGCNSSTLNCGQIVSLNPDGSGFTQLLDLSTTNAGNEPQLGRIHNAGITLYSSSGGGANDYGAISIFHTRSSSLTTLHVFTALELRGANAPTFDPLGNLWDESLYGAEDVSPTGGIGTIFEISGKPPVLTIPVVIDFNGSSNYMGPVYGAYGDGGPVWSTSSQALIGTWYAGGPSTGGLEMDCKRPDGTEISVYGCGTVFSYQP